MPSVERKCVYIAGPISSGDLVANVNQATAAFDKLARSGVVAPWCPHWSVYAKPAIRTVDDIVYCRATVAGTNEPHIPHADWLAIDLAWIAHADAVLRLPGASKGADIECAFARSRVIPVFDSVDEVIEWARA